MSLASRIAPWRDGRGVHWVKVDESSQEFEEAGVQAETGVYVTDDAIAFPVKARDGNPAPALRWPPP